MASLKEKAWRKAHIGDEGPQGSVPRFGPVQRRSQGFPVPKLKPNCLQYHTTRESGISGLAAPARLASQWTRTIGLAAPASMEAGVSQIGGT